MTKIMTKKQVVIILIFVFIVSRNIRRIFRLLNGINKNGL